MKLEISHSSCSMARSCPMKYKWRYVDGYKPIRKSNALALGSIVHEAFDKYYQGADLSTVSIWLSSTMANQIANASLTEQEDLQIIKHTALGMWMFSPHNMSEFQEINSEKEFTVRIDGLRQVLFRGKTDRLVKKDGKWWIGELKTTGLSFQPFKNRMSVSDQVTAYVYAWRKLGYPVEGVIFDYIRKPKLRKGVNEDCASFSQRIQQDYKARPNEYFKRHYEYRTEKDVNIWLSDTRKAVRRIRGIWRGDAIRNPDNCWNYNAECPYKKICFTDKPDPLTVQLYYEKKK